MRKNPNDINSESGLLGLGPIPGLAPVAAFNREGIENLLETKGFTAYHYIHCLNPDSQNVSSPVNPNTQAAQWGYDYFEVRKIKVVPQNFSLNNQLNAQGIWGLHTVLLNITGYYLDTPAGQEREVVHASPNDLIIIDTDPNGTGITTIMRQKFQYNPNGPIRLNFRIQGVKMLKDANRYYREGEDFAIVDGAIQFLPGGAKPAMSPNPATMSIVYWVRPTYIVKNVPHSLRILPSNSQGHGALPREAVYAPQLLVAQQAWLRHDDYEIPDFNALPDFPKYPTSPNTTGGTA